MMELQKQQRRAMHERQQARRIQSNIIDTRLYYPIIDSNEPTTTRAQQGQLLGTHGDYRNYCQEAQHANTEHVKRVAQTN